MVIMTNQQQADLALHHWQSHRDLTPAERMEILIRDFFSQHVKDDYAHTIERVAKEMKHG
jgi:hypothetical protein